MWATTSSFPGRLDVLHEVHSPQLQNTRDVLVYLPRAYARSQASWPVLYMHDGQNLFDPATSFAGDWGVHTALARAPKKARRAIVVGLPNMGIERINEYSPFVDERNGGGAGDAYLAWIVETVKPMIDARYRTRPAREATGIVGSSMGGLISLYALFHVSATFGVAGVMSPALWFANGAIFPFVERAAYVRGRIYLDVGTREGEGTLRNARAMRDLLEAKGYAPGRDLHWVEEAGGMHNEAAWGRRLRKALPFLLDVDTR